MTRSTIRVWLTTLLLLGSTGVASAQRYPTATVTISGTPSTTSSGTMTIGFDGYSKTIPYGPYSSASSIASAFAASFSADPIAEHLPKLCGNGVCAKANGPVITFQLKHATSYGSFTLLCPGSCPFQAAVTSTQARPIIVWPQPASIAPGTALSTIQLNAITGIPGTFTYTPSVGFVPSVGTQTLSVVFTPDDEISYTIASDEVQLFVGGNPLPVITSVNPVTATVGSLITFSGANFGALPGGVTIDASQAQVLFWTDGTVTVVVPLGASAGAVILTTAGGLSAHSSFTVPQSIQACPI